MAHKKAGGSSRNGRDSESKRLGVKKFGGENVISGNIILRQRGTKWHPGTGRWSWPRSYYFCHNRGQCRISQKGQRTHLCVCDATRRGSGIIGNALNHPVSYRPG